MSVSRISFYFLGLIYQLSINLPNAHCDCMSSLSSDLKDNICKKLDPITFADHHLKFEIDECQYDESCPSSVMSGFSRCYIDSMKNSTTELIVDLTYPQLIWKGNAKATYENCPFAKDPTDVTYVYNVLLSLLSVQLKLKFEMKGDEGCSINDVTAEADLSQGMIRSKPGEPKDATVVAQAASLLNQDNNFVTKLFSIVKEELETKIASGIKENFDTKE